MATVRLSSPQARVAMQNLFRPEVLADTSLLTQQDRDAALLRATTELFTQEVAHDRDEIRRYEELATHFLARVSPEDRCFVAEQLAPRRDAPRSIVCMLAKDCLEVACPIIRQSPVLSALDLLTIIAATGRDHHRLIAARADLSEEVVEALRLLEDRERRSAADAVPSDMRDVADHARFSAPGVRAAHASLLQFLALDRPARLRLLAGLAMRPPVQQQQHAGAASRVDRAFRRILSAAQIVSHARRGEKKALIEAIATGLELGPDEVAACLDDATGEPAAVLLKALGLDNVQAQQVLLLATASVGFNAEAFLSLSDLYAGMEKWIAEALVEAWRRDIAQPTPRHHPHLAENGARARPAATGSRAPDAIQPPERASGS